MSADTATVGEAAIEAWMVRAVQAYGPDYWEHLSVPSIDNRFSDRSSRLSGATECFQAAMRVRDRLRIAVAVRMAIELRPTDTRQGLDLISSLAKLELELWQNPPFLVMTAGAEPASAEERAHNADAPLLLGGYGVQRFVREGFDPEI
jgi:hypothetical protein